MSKALYNYVRIRVETVSTTETAVIRFKKTVKPIVCLQVRLANPL